MDTGLGVVGAIVMLAGAVLAAAGLLASKPTSESAGQGCGGLLVFFGFILVVTYLVRLATQKR